MQKESTEDHPLDIEPNKTEGSPRILKKDVGPPIATLHAQASVDSKSNEVHFTSSLATFTTQLDEFITSCARSLQDGPTLLPVSQAITERASIQTERNDAGKPALTTGIMSFYVALPIVSLNADDPKDTSHMASSTLSIHRSELASKKARSAPPRECQARSLPGYRQNMPREIIISASQ